MILVTSKCSPYILKNMHHSDLRLARINEIRLSMDKVVWLVKEKTGNGEYG